MGAFSTKFSTTPGGETMDGTQKSLGPKMMARTISITMQNLVEIARRTSAWEDEMWCFLLFIYVCNAPALNGHKLCSCFIEERIASVFLGRFRCGLQLFSGMKCPLQRTKQIWKLLLGGAMIGATMREEIFKIWENECKVCAHHFDHLKASWKKTSTTALCPMYCRCAPI